MATHTIKVDAPSASIAKCKWCDDEIAYGDEDTERWVHSEGDVDHAAEPTFTVRDSAVQFDVGDGLVIEAIDGSWLAEVFDTTDECHTAYAEGV